MKRLFVVMSTLFVFSTLISYAQQNIPGNLELKVSKFREMKNTGLSLFLTGTVCTVGGIALMSSGSWEDSSQGSGGAYYTTTDGSAIVGVLLTIVGVELLPPGIILYAIGRKKMKKYKMQLDNLTFTPVFNPDQVGGSLTYAF